VFADPPEWWPEDTIVLPAVINDTSPQGAEAVAGHDQWTSPGAVLGLPCLLGCPVPAPDTQRDLGVIAEMDHPHWVVNGAAAPASGLVQLMILSSGLRHHAAQSALRSV
jgi:hypothetical protein